MAKAAESFVCQSCGAAYRKWQGRCDACGEWNTIAEEAPKLTVPKGLSAGRGKAIGFASLNAQPDNVKRAETGIAELDRVLGGGLVPGSAILIGGDPGIGKSTLLLQAVAVLARKGATALYISGEEAVAQIGLRAQRLGLADAPVMLAAANSLRDILAGIDTAVAQNKSGAPAVIVIDSIQTIFADNIESAPGTVNQVRACANELIRVAKQSNAAVFLVGHVTKDGQIAGPRVVEHMVDTVLYFEGERSHQFRILRAVKNRFGATDEIGVFSMTDGGLAEVANPSALFLGRSEAGKGDPVAGSAIFAGMEGTRPLLVEIQALVAPSPLATPRRTVVGWDSGRLAMVLAVLDARCGLRYSGCDVYLNVAGGLRVVEPAADLAVAAALLSSLADSPAPERTVFFGEISLAGEVRPVSQAEARLKEAAKLGFEHAVMPAGAKNKVKGLQTSELVRLNELVELFPAARAAAKRAAAGRDRGGWGIEE
ncbi:MAG TPA: DNA repair protein RadA [Ferrovibrio sp.]|uniref:DNA repair protein RadA n=1 Tax=Ferrovibrio sp. TaxID=1917215 RepID=UPI002B4B35CD|nr:DNA repair protein RadA [Ferrovibrio sp.]HLT78333.1 DNA repair protein RadA [Ferrovibrio sp.]